MRFSYAGRSDARASRTAGNQAEIARELYDPVRMERRFHLFENICLPSIAAQTNKDFRIAVLASTIMPDVYKQRLAASVERIPQIDIVYSDVDYVVRAFQPWQQQQTAGLTYATAHFRLDDDDAIGASVIDRIAAACDLAPHVGILSFPRGLHVSYWDDKVHLMREYAPYIAIALCRIGVPGQLRVPYVGKHLELHRNDRSLLDPLCHAYLHTAHESNDTRARQSRHIRKMIEGDPQYDTPAGHRSVDEILKSEFPGFSRARLEEIMRAAARIGAASEGSAGPDTPTA